MHEDRARRMRQAHKDVQKSGTTKIGFGQFENRMLRRDDLRKKAEYESRKIRLR